MGTARPRVVILDDQARSAESVRLHLRHSATVEVLQKQDLTESTFPKCDLVLVDYDLEGWQMGEGQSASLLQPHSGVGLAVNIIEFTERRYVEEAPLVVLLSGKLDSHRDFPPSLSQQIDLDWVLSKRDPNLRQALQALAAWRRTVDRGLAVASDFGGEAWLDFLGVAKRGSARERVRWSLEGTERPIATKTRHATARVLAAWLLQRLIGYPRPLWSVEYLCARLGLSAWKRQTMRARRQVEELFANSRYAGPFAAVWGTQWWKALIEERLEQLTGGASTDPVLVRRALAKSLKSVRFSSTEGPLVAIVEESGRPTGESAALADTVQVSPFGWPANADPAFMLWQDVQRDADLRGLVAPFAGRDDRVAAK
jgi:hypothetical protein